MAKKKRIGEILIEQGAIDRHQLKIALARQQKWGKKLGETLVDLQFITEDKLMEILSLHYRMPAIDIVRYGVDPKVKGIVTAEFCQTHHIVPVAVKKIRGKTRLVVATSDPSNVGGLDELRFKANVPLAVTVATVTSIEKVIRDTYYSDLERDAITLSKSIKSKDEKMQIFRDGGEEVLVFGDRDDVGVSRKTAPAPSTRGAQLRRLLQVLVRKSILSREEVEKILDER